MNHSRRFIELKPLGRQAGIMDSFEDAQRSLLTTKPGPSSNKEAAKINWIQSTCEDKKTASAFTKAVSS